MPTNKEPICIVLPDRQTLSSYWALSTHLPKGHEGLSCPEEKDARPALHNNLAGPSNGTIGRAQPINEAGTKLGRRHPAWYDLAGPSTGVRGGHRAVHTQTPPRNRHKRRRRTRRARPHRAHLHNQG